MLLIDQVDLLRDSLKELRNQQITLIWIDPVNRQS